jgi:hypothetical protein
LIHGEEEIVMKNETAAGQPKYVPFALTKDVVNRNVSGGNRT